MEFIGHFFLGIFIALIIFATISFGFMLFVWFVAFAAAVSALVMARVWLRRIYFLYFARDRHHLRKKPPRVIDADYRDISDEE